MMPKPKKCSIYALFAPRKHLLYGPVSMATNKTAGPSAWLKIGRYGRYAQRESMFGERPNKITLCDPSLLSGVTIDRLV